MIIDSNNHVNSSTTTGSKARQVAEPKDAAAKRAPAQPAPADKDSVSLSAKAQTMGRLEAQIANAPDVDEDKVAAVKAAISEGRYHVDSRTIAERMLKQDSLLGG